MENAMRIDCGRCLLMLYDEGMVACSFTLDQPADTPAAQDGITASQRADAVDSMIAAAMTLRVSDDVLFLAVACLDRYLLEVCISCDVLQFIGLACLYTSAKHSAAAAPPIHAFTSLAALPPSILISTVTPSSLFALLEADILEVMDNSLAGIVTSKQHMHSIMQGVPATSFNQQEMEQMHSMIAYLTETTLLEQQLAPWPSRQLAAGAYVLAHTLLGIPLDCNLLVQLSGNTFDELQTVLPYLCALHTTLCCAMAGGKPYAVSVKYCSESGHHIAQVTPLVDVNDPRLANKQQGYSASVFYVETILNILLQNLHVALS